MRDCSTSPLPPPAGVASTGAWSLPAAESAVRDSRQGDGARGEEASASTASPSRATTPACHASNPSATSVATRKSRRSSAVSVARSHVDKPRSAASCSAPTRPDGAGVTVIVSSGSSCSPGSGFGVPVASHSEKPASATGRRSSSAASSTRPASVKIPLREPASRTIQTPSSRTTSAWKRDTPGPSRRTSASSLRPSRSGTPGASETSRVAPSGGSIRSLASPASRVASMFGTPGEGGGREAPATPSK